MPKFLTLLSFFVVIVLAQLFTPKNAFAACSYTATPSIITDPDYRNSMTITTSSECSSFITATNHKVILYPQSAQNNVGLYANYFNIVHDVQPTDEHTITASINLFQGSIGRNNLGAWYAKVCAATQVSDCGGDPSSNPNVVALASFEVQQQGGSTVQLEPVIQELELGETPQVLLINANPGNAYLFWWEGDHFSVQEATVPSSSNTPISLNPGDDGDRFKKIGEKKICATVKNGRSISLGTAGLTCSYSTTFTYRAVKITRQPTCLINPSQPTVQDNISFTATNLPKNSNFRLDSINSGTTTTIADNLNSGPNGQIFQMVVGKGISEGYSATLKLYDQNGNEACPATQFTVQKYQGPRPTTVVPTATTLNCSGSSCSKATGDPCDVQAGVTGGGISTSVGCIPTDPSVLVKSLVKVAAGIGGGIALLLMIFGAIQWIISGGNPDNLKRAQDQFVNAAIGLLFLLLAIMLLRVIGVDILQIPGFKP